MTALEAINAAETEVLSIVDSDELYDMLPGNGEDDYICGHLRKEIAKAMACLRQRALADELRKVANGRR